MDAPKDGGVPPFANKNVVSAYAKTEGQTYWARRPSGAQFDSQRSEKRRRLNIKEGQELDSAPSPKLPRKAKLPASDAQDSSKVIVIHPGGRNLRIGRASDLIPLPVPNVIARRLKDPAQRRKHVPQPAKIDNTLDERIANIRTEVKNRMAHFKVRHQLNTSPQASAYNATANPEIVPEFNDPLRTEWTDTQDQKDDFFVGDQALKIASPDEEGFSIRWPFSRGTFNTESYHSAADILADIQDILTSILSVDFEIPPAAFEEYSVVLVIPDNYDSVYLREMARLLLSTMGFKQLCVQQESLCATFGAGMSAACVVDLGATKCSIACVDDGAVIPDSRISLAYGGDDVTTFLLQNLLRINFPCQDVDLSQLHDWHMMETIKESACTLQETAINLETHTLEVRRPNQPLKKYTFKVFDEVMLAPMSLFAPHVIPFDSRIPTRMLWAPHETMDEALDMGSNAVTSTMRVSVKQIFLPPSAPSPSPSQDPETDISSANTPKPPINYPDKFIELNAGKVPLDIAILESLSSVGSEDRIKRFASSVLVVGGMAKLSGISWALASRVGGFMAQRHSTPGAGAVTIIPPPREIDPQILAWKGVSVLNQLEVCSELWVRADDFEALGMKAFKDRIMCFNV